MSKSDHSRQQEIDRYVLGDPTQDWEFFESQMLDDPDLALSVAKGVEEMGRLAKALEVAADEAADNRLSNSGQVLRSRYESSKVSSATSSGQYRAPWMPGLASVAVVLMIVGISAFRESLRVGGWPPSDVIQEPKALLVTSLNPSVVRSWLGLEDWQYEHLQETFWDGEDLLQAEMLDASLGYDLNGIQDDSTELLATNDGVESDPVAASEEADWLIEAAQAFYLSSASSEAGASGQGS